jgi:MoaA/NifB/PqqE/SkfB family radical SAM enzyme
MYNINHFNLEITKKCNQKCFYCFNDSGYSQSKNELSVEQWKNSLTEISQLNFKSVHITGGEPFLHPKIVEILQHSIDLGLQTTILSNGFKIKKLADENPFLFSQIKTAQISLDSMKPEKHNARRGFQNAFPDAISAINTFLNLNVPVEISTTVSEQNLQDLFDIGAYCKTIGASLIVRPLISTGRATDLKHNDSFYSELEEAIYKLQNDFQVKVIDDRFNYVADDVMSERFFVEKGTITVEATGKIRGISFLQTDFQNLLQSLKAA